jgi:hypothetical protein
MIRGYSEGVILYWPMKTEKTEKQKKPENRRQKASMTIKSISFPN